MLFWKSILSGCIMVGMLVSPVMAADNVESCLLCQSEYSEENDMTLIPLILDDVYYNYEYNYSFRIPPVWKDKVELVESRKANGSTLEFVYTSADGQKTSIGSISTVPSNEYDEVKDNYAVARTNEFVYVFSSNRMSPYDGKSILDPELAALEAVFDGVDDLFNLVDVRSELAKSVCDGRNHEVRMSLKGDAETTLFRNTEGVIMVPLREVAQALGYEVFWSGEFSEITVIGNERIVRVSTGKYAAHNTDTDVVMDAAPVIVESKTYVPLNFIYEVLL